MSDINEFWKGLKAVRSQMGKDRRADAAKDFPEASRIAKLIGLEFVRHTEVHYQVKCPAAGWILNVYPGNRRLYPVQGRTKPPFLELPDEWDFFDVLEVIARNL